MTTIVILDLPAAGARDAVLKLMPDALPVARAFDACQGLELLANQDDAGNILIYERWQSRAHYDAYRAFHADTGFSTSFRAMLPARPTVRVFDIDHAYP